MLSGVSVCVCVSGLSLSCLSSTNSMVLFTYFGSLHRISSKSSALCMQSCMQTRTEKKSYQQQKSSVAHTLYWSSFFRLCKYTNHERKISFIFFCYTYSFSFYFVTHRVNEEVATVCPQKWHERDYVTTVTNAWRTTFYTIKARHLVTCDMSIVDYPSSYHHKTH